VYTVLVHVESQSTIIQYLAISYTVMVCESTNFFNSLW